jgi:small conductance mechanosensitive channel
MIDLNEWLQTALTAVRLWAPAVLATLAVLAVGWIVAGWMKRLSARALGAARVDPILVPFISGIIHVGAIVIVAVTALGVLGVETGSFIAVIGAAGLAIALAFQSTFSNFASGVMLLTFRPFEVGHVVEVGGVTGSVTEVGIFTCLLTTPDNVRISVPNSQIFGATIKNFSASETRRIDLVVGVGYRDDLGVAIRTCQDVLAADPRVLSEPESTVNLVVRPWVRAEDYWSARFDLTRALKEQLEAAGCSIPFPQRDVHLLQAT